MDRAFIRNTTPKLWDTISDSGYVAHINGEFVTSVQLRSMADAMDYMVEQYEADKERFATP